MPFAYKVLTVRTLAAVLSGEASYWRLSNPSRCAARVRGSMLLAVRDSYLAERIDVVSHWCPLDSGGVRLGFRPLHSGIVLDDLLFGAASLRRLADLLQECPEATSLIELGRPLGAGHLRTMAEPALEALSRFTDDNTGEWVYEVRLDASRPLDPKEVACLVCPNTAVRKVRRLMGRRFRTPLLRYNPRWTLDNVELDPVRWRT